MFVLALGTITLGATAAVPLTGIAAFVRTTPSQAMVEPLAPHLQTLVPLARELMSHPGTTWSHATAVRNLIRSAFGPGTVCNIMADAFLEVGTAVGLPLREVAASANLLNLYDTHVTIEVYLSGERRWAISDPTFNGYWTNGLSGRPLGVFALQKVAAGQSPDTIYWHGAGTENSLLPSNYYVDPIYLYRYINIEGWTHDGAVAIVPSNTSHFAFNRRDYVDAHIGSLETTPPHSAVPLFSGQVHAGSFSISGPLTRGYLGSVLTSGSVTLLGGRGSVAVGPEEAVVLTVHTPKQGWSIDTNGMVYQLAFDNGLQISPIVLAPQSGSIGLYTSTKQRQQSVYVTVFEARQFAIARETVRGSTRSR